MCMRFLARRHIERVMGRLNVRYRVAPSLVSIATHAADAWRAAHRGELKNRDAVAFLTADGMLTALMLGGDRPTKSGVSIGDLERFDRAFTDLVDLWLVRSAAVLVLSIVTAAFVLASWICHGFAGDGVGIVCLTAIVACFLVDDECLRALLRHPAWLPYAFARGRHDREFDRRAVAFVDEYLADEIMRQVDESGHVNSSPASGSLVYRF